MNPDTMSAIAISIDEHIYKIDGRYYADNVCYDLVKRYSDNFECVRLICRVKCLPDCNIGERNKLIFFKNVDIYEIPFFNSITLLLKNYRQIKLVVSQAIRGCNVALVRIPSIIGFIVLGKLRKGTRFALEVVANSYEAFKGNKGRARIQAFIMHLCTMYYCARAFSIAFVTKYSLQKKYELNKCKENNTHYSSIELKKDFFCKFNVKHEIFTDTTIPLHITHVSNIISGDLKGHREVIEVAEILVSRGRNVVITFAGEGPDVGYYKKLAQDKNINANFIGFIDRNRLRELLLESDFFLFPSKSEGLPKVLIEAMAVSVPCIASNVGGIPELLPESNLFDREDVIGMSNRILELSTNKQEYLETSNLMYTTALRYEASQLSEQRARFYAKLMKT